MKLKLDLHVHTARSHDAFTPLKNLLTLTKKRGLNGVALTDHDTITESPLKGIIVIPGVEISSLEGHVIGLGLPTSVAKGLPADQTIDEIHRLGGVAIIPHPYDLFRSSIRPDCLSSRPDAIEVVNSSSFFHSVTWRRAKRFAEWAKLPMVGGSDSHIPETLGLAHTVIEADSEEPASILEAIRNGFVAPSGHPVSTIDRVKKFLRGLTYG